MPVALLYGYDAAPDLRRRSERRGCGCWMLDAGRAGNEDGIVSVEAFDDSQ